MHIEIREKQGKKKYYLAYSFRDDGKVRKIRKYLGQDISKAEIHKKIKTAESQIKEQLRVYNEIRDPLKTVLSGHELKILENMVSKRMPKIHHLSEREWLYFTEKFTYDTNAIEGSIVTFSEVKGILEEEKWPKHTTKEDISETYGVADAIRYIRKSKVHISIALIKKLHLLVFRNSKSFAGSFRKKGVEVVVRDRLGGIVHQGAPSKKISSLLIELISWYNKNKNKYPPILLAAVVHNQFETIHPFQDGNGRVGRLLLSNILLKHGLPPVNIELKNRKEYYFTLQEYQQKGNIRPTIELILKEYKQLKSQTKR